MTYMKKTIRPVPVVNFSKHKSEHIHDTENEVLDGKNLSINMENTKEIQEVFIHENTDFMNEASEAEGRGYTGNYLIAVIILVVILLFFFAV